MANHLKNFTNCIDPHHARISFFWIGTGTGTGTGNPNSELIISDSSIIEIIYKTFFFFIALYVILNFLSVPIIIIIRIIKGGNIQKMRLNDTKNNTWIFEDKRQMLAKYMQMQHIKLMRAKDALYDISISEDTIATMFATWFSAGAHFTSDLRL